MTYKIIIHSLPASGHIHPLSVVVERLVSEYKCHCIWYSFEEFRPKIEKTGAEFRPLLGVLEDWTPKFASDKKTLRPGILVNKLLELNRNNSLKIARDIDAEKPDLVLIDSAAYHAKWALRYYQTHYKNADKLHKSNKNNYLVPSSPLPPVILFETSFVLQDKVFPNKAESKLLMDVSFFEKIRTVFSILSCVGGARRLAKEHGIEFIFPLTEIFGSNTKDKIIVATYPGFQARHHLLSKNIKFIGACIDENLRVNEINENLKTVLDKYPEINPCEVNNNASKQSYLIYLSLGTVLDDSISVYAKLIEGIKLLNVSSLNKKIENSDFVISAGRAFEILLNKFIDLPKNVLIVKSAPQLDILKRASLFVTHCGMNSMNEAIHYAVPMICVPIGSDQPLIGDRASTELGIGVILDFVKMTPVDIQNAIVQVLNDEGYYERVFNASLLSRKYNGKINGSDQIINFIKNKKIEEKFQEQTLDAHQAISQHIIKKTVYGLLYLLRAFLNI